MAHNCPFSSVHRQDSVATAAGPIRGWPTSTLAGRNGYAQTELRESSRCTNRQSARPRLPESPLAVWRSASSDTQSFLSHSIFPDTCVLLNQQMHRCEGKHLPLRRLKEPAHILAPDLEAASRNAGNDIILLALLIPAVCRCTLVTLPRAMPSSSVSFASMSATGVNSSGMMKSGA